MTCNDYELLNDFELLFEKPIIVWGAGKYGKELINFMGEAGITIDYVCDKNNKNILIKGKKVISVAEMLELVKKEQYNIIIASADYYYEMFDILTENKIEKCKVYSSWAVTNTILIHNEDSRLNQNFRNHIVDDYRMHFKCNNIEVIVKNINRFFTDYPEVCVLQPAKVGSMTVVCTLLANEIRPMHIHGLSIPEKVIDLSEEIQRCKDKIQENGMKFISMVREPIARDISFYMQTFEKNVYGKNNLNLENDILKMIDHLSEVSQEFKWFEKDFKDITGINIFDYNFDREKGYMIIKEGNIEVLLLTLEKMNENEKVIAKFIGKNNIKLENSNTADTKMYNDVYKKIKERIRIPKYIVERYYKDNKYMDFFYNEVDKKQFLKKWEKI